MKTHHLLDCIIIGGGPAGLTAGLYLARYRRKVVIFDNQHSRTSTIPLSHNYPAFPKGISGLKLLQRLKKQLEPYQVPIVCEFVENIGQTEDGVFEIQTKSGTQRAKNILLATGVQDIEHPLFNLNRDMSKGLIRHCPICDGYEVINKKIAIFSKGSSGVSEALFLRRYTPHIVFLSLENPPKKHELNKLHKAGISIESRCVLSIKSLANTLSILFTEEETLEIDCIYSALGVIQNNQLSENLNAAHKKGLLLVNKKQETSVKGLFAAGDIVSGLHQLCVAEAQAAIAATAIHHRLICLHRDI